MWIYTFFWMILLSRSSAYFGLTGKAQIRDVKDIDQEAAFMAADDPDSIYTWNENGYYTAPSNEYERIVLSPQPDSESNTRGLRLKKNAGPRKPNTEEHLPKNDESSPGKLDFETSNGRVAYAHAHHRVPGHLPHIRPNQSYTRRHAGPHPVYYPALTRVPRYPRPPYPIQIRYPHNIQRYGAGRARMIPPGYASRFPNGRGQQFSPYGKPTPEQAISRHVGSVNINRLLAKKNGEHDRNARTTFETPHLVSGRRKPTGDGLDEYSTQNDQASRRDSSNGDTTDSSKRIFHSSRSRKRPVEGISTEAARPSQLQHDATSEIKPLFVTKDIPSIMKLVGVDEKGNAYVTMDEDTDPSSIPSPIMSEAGSRATDMPPLIPSSDINKKEARKECNDLKLTRKQRKFCKRDPGLPQVLREATATSVAECQYQFRFERWNCSTGNTRIHLLSKGNRETAFLFAISSAGLTHSIARACAEGHLERCSCDETYSDPVNEEAWMWGGCGDNVHFAAKFVRQFLRPKSRSRDIRAEVEKHNSDLGIRVVRQSVQKTCKCHGVSGSCTTKTCWRKVAPFYEIGERIKNAYNRSVKVGSINSADGRTQLIRLRRTRRNRPELRPTRSNVENETMPWRTPTASTQYQSDISHRELSNASRIARQRLTVEEKRVDVSRMRDNPRSNELVYLEKSPQYCRRTRYSLGTKGRLCDEERNCDNICCGRGYTKHTRIIRRSCECEVRWCCYVECKTCTETRDIYTCK